MLKERVLHDDFGRFFGGSAEEAVDSVVKAFIDYFRDYFEKGVPPAEAAR